MFHVADRKSIRHQTIIRNPSSIFFNVNINKAYKNKCVFVCLYLHNSIKTWDSVDLSSLSDKLALYFIPHGVDGVGVRANERHTLCCLERRQSQHVLWYAFNTRNAKTDKQSPTSPYSTTPVHKAELGLHVNEIFCGTLKSQDALHYFIIYTWIQIYKINEGKHIMGERLKESTIKLPWVPWVYQFRMKFNDIRFMLIRLVNEISFYHCLHFIYQSLCKLFVFREKTITRMNL